MAAPDKKTVMKDLLEMGKAKGQLTTKEILDALGELDFEPGCCGYFHRLHGQFDRVFRSD